MEISERSLFRQQANFVWYRVLYTHCVWAGFDFSTLSNPIRRFFDFENIFCVHTQFTRKENKKKLQNFHMEKRITNNDEAMEQRE